MRLRWAISSIVGSLAILAAAANPAAAQCSGGTCYGPSYGGYSAYGGYGVGGYAPVGYDGWYGGGTIVLPSYGTPSYSAPVVSYAPTTYAPTTYAAPAIVQATAPAQPAAFTRQVAQSQQVAATQSTGAVARTAQSTVQSTVQQSTTTTTTPSAPLAKKWYQLTDHPGYYGYGTLDPQGHVLCEWYWTKGWDKPRKAGAGPQSKARNFGVDFYSLSNQPKEAIITKDSKFLEELKGAMGGVQMPRHLKPSELPRSNDAGIQQAVGDYLPEPGEVFVEVSDDGGIVAGKQVDLPLEAMAVGLDPAWLVTISVGLLVSAALVALNGLRRRRAAAYAAAHTG